MKPKTAAQFLRRIFETDPSSPEYAELAYGEAGLGLGTKPWWDPLNKVWADEENPYVEGTDRWHLWRDARALLDRLHADYEAHKGESHE